MQLFLISYCDSIIKVQRFFQRGDNSDIVIFKHLLLQNHWANFAILKLFLYPYIETVKVQVVLIIHSKYTHLNTYSWMYAMFFCFLFNLIQILMTCVKIVNSKPETVGLVLKNVASDLRHRTSVKNDDPMSFPQTAQVINLLCKEIIMWHTYVTNKLTHDGGGIENLSFSD